jgi:hypothetical protein
MSEYTRNRNRINLELQFALNESYISLLGFNLFVFVFVGRLDPGISGISGISEISEISSFLVY